MSLDKNNIKKIVILILFTAILLLTVMNFGTIWDGISKVVAMFTPFIAGAAIAFVINVPMKSIEDRLLEHTKISKKLARIVSFILAWMFVALIIFLVFRVVLPELNETFVKLGRDIKEFWPRAQEWILVFFQETPEAKEWIRDLEKQFLGIEAWIDKFDWKMIIEQVFNVLKGAGSILDSTFTVAKVLVDFIVNLFIGIIFSIYLLLQKDTLKIQSKKALYAFFDTELVDKIIDVARLSQITFSGFISGQCLEAIILGTIVFILMSVFGFPYPLLIAVLIGFTALIPIFGPFIGGIIGAFLILLENPTQALIFIVMLLILQQIEGNLIYPHVVGSSVGLPSIWVLVAITVGGSLMGVVGMLIFIPLVSVIYTLFRGCVYKRLEKRNIKNIT